MKITNMKECCEAIRSADISTDDWQQVLIDSVTDNYARGYLSAKLEEIDNSLSIHDEDYRYELLRISTRHIWGKDTTLAHLTEEGR